MKYTYKEIANCFYLWQEYVDPDGNDSQEDFESMTFQERIDIIEGCFGIVDQVEIQRNKMA